MKYQITIIGQIDQDRIRWFRETGFEASCSSTLAGSITHLTGQVVDQAHLRGLMNKLWDLNFEVVQVRRLETNASMGDQTNG